MIKMAIAIIMKMNDEILIMKVNDDNYHTTNGTTSVQVIHIFLTQRRRRTRRECYYGMRSEREKKKKKERRHTEPRPQRPSTLTFN